MSEMGLRLQPFIIIVGPNTTDIHKSYVRVYLVMYEVPSLARAVDIYFKLFVTFNISYAPECENVCYFIQWAVYEYNSKFDLQVPSVYTILNKVKKAIS